MSAIITITGNLTRDPEVRQLGNSNACTFSVGVRTAQKGSDGQYISNFYDCTYFGKMGESFASRAQKGTGVVVSGNVAMTSYKTKDGADRQALRITVNEAEITARGKAAGTQAQTTHAAAPAQQDSLPF